MERNAIRSLLEQIAGGQVGVEAALRRLTDLPFEDLGFARIDHHRSLRCGFPEVIFGLGKRPEHVLQIFQRIAATGANVLATRIRPQTANLVLGKAPKAEYDPVSRTLALRQAPVEPSSGFVALVCAGTSDLPVAEEARITAEMMGRRVRTFYDVGVAGIHRLLVHSSDLRTADVLVVVAGMEGALPSVVGGLVQAPVIAVPTSVGYGASFNGLAALLAMLNSCAAGVSVVNIDNGFGAGYQAAMISRLADRARGGGSIAAREDAADGIECVDGELVEESVRVETNLTEVITVQAAGPQRASPRSSKTKQRGKRTGSPALRGTSHGRRK